MPRVMTVFTLGLSLSLAVACGPAVSQQTGTAPADLQRVPPQKAPEPLPRAPAGGAADLGVPMTVQPGKVSVVLSAPSFKEGEVIQAAIANGLEQTVHAEDSQTDCSIATLERSDAGAWQPVPGCALGRAPMVVSIGPGRGRAVTINPFSFHLRMGMPEGTKPVVRAGTYRIKFTYRLSVPPLAGEPLAAFSRAFSIRR